MQNQYFSSCGHCGPDLVQGNLSVDTVLPNHSRRIGDGLGFRLVKVCGREIAKIEKMREHYKGKYTDIRLRPREKNPKT